MGKDGGRMHVGLRAAFLYVDSARYAIDGLDAPKVRAVRKVQRVAVANFRFLRREGVLVYRALRRPANARNKAQARNRSLLGNQLVL
jgi:hypothetical protein